MGVAIRYRPPLGNREIWNGKKKQQRTVKRNHGPNVCLPGARPHGSDQKGRGVDDLHQWDFMRNQQMVKEIERLRVLLTTTNQRRESWKVRALMAEAQLVEATAKTGNKGGDGRGSAWAPWASPENAHIA